MGNKTPCPCSPGYPEVEGKKNQPKLNSDLLFGDVEDVTFQI